MTSKATDHALGPEGWGRRYFGADEGRGARVAVRWSPPASAIPRGGDSLAGLREGGEKRRHGAARPGPTATARSYGLNSYGKPALVLQTLEGLLGEETMVKVLRTYARRYRFAHPTTEDFIATVNEVTGRDWRPVLRPDLLLLRPLRLRGRGRRASRAAGRPAGSRGRTASSSCRPPREGARSGTARGPSSRGSPSCGTARCVLPVELRVELRRRAAGDRDAGTAATAGGASGTRERRSCGRWWTRGARSRSTWTRRTTSGSRSEGPARRAATKWAARYLFWLQNLLELHAVAG